MGISRKLVVFVLPVLAWASGCTLPIGNQSPSVDGERIKISILFNVDEVALGTKPGSKTSVDVLVDKFNASQSSIELVRYPPDGDLNNTLKSGIASRKGPDIVGALDANQLNRYPGTWLDLAPLVSSSGFDLGQLQPSAGRLFQTAEGLIGLPIGVSPTVFLYNSELFDESGLYYPPSQASDEYKMSDGSMVQWNWNAVSNIGKLLTLDSLGRFADEPGFDRTQAIQFGFTWGFDGQPTDWAAIWGPGSLLASGDKRGSYTAQIPSLWRVAWRWTYNGIWGTEPFIGSSSMEASAAFSQGHPFGSGHVGMTAGPEWFLQYSGGMRSSELAALPTWKGAPGGVVDGLAFAIWKGTHHPKEAFSVLTYLIGSSGTGSLILGEDGPAPYGISVPSWKAAFQPWLTSQKAIYPWVKNWNVLQDELNVPAPTPAPMILPNFDAVWTRGIALGELMRATPDLNIDKELNTYQQDLNALFNH